MSYIRPPRAGEQPHEAKAELRPVIVPCVWRCGRRNVKKRKKKLRREKDKKVEARSGAAREHVPAVSPAKLNRSSYVSSQMPRAQVAPELAIGPALTRTASLTSRQLRRRRLWTLARRLECERRGPSRPIVAPLAIRPLTADRPAGQFRSSRPAYPLQAPARMVAPLQSRLAVGRGPCRLAVERARVINPQLTRASSSSSLPAVDHASPRARRPGRGLCPLPAASRAGLRSQHQACHEQRGTWGSRGSLPRRAVGHCVRRRIRTKRR